MSGDVEWLERIVYLLSAEMYGSGMHHDWPFVERSPGTYCIFHDPLSVVMETAVSRISLLHCISFSIAEISLW